MLRPFIPLGGAHLLRVWLLSVVLDDLGRNERRRSRKTLHTRWQHRSTDAVISETDFDGVRRPLGVVGRGKRPHKNILCFEISVDDLT